MNSFCMKCFAIGSLERFRANITLDHFSIIIVLPIIMIAESSFGFKNFFANVTLRFFHFFALSRLLDPLWSNYLSPEYEFHQATEVMAYAFRLEITKLKLGA